MTGAMINGPGHRERGAVVDLAWEVRGGSVRLALHLSEPPGQYEMTQLGEVVRRVEALVSTIDRLTDLDRRNLNGDPVERAGAVE